MPFTYNGLPFRPDIVKFLKCTIELSTGILSSENLYDAPVIASFTAVESKSRKPLKMGFVSEPVMSISPLSIPDSAAVPLGRNGLTIRSGKCIIEKSSRNGEVAVLSLSTPRAVITFTESTISEASACRRPVLSLNTDRSMSKSPTRSRP